MAKYIAPPDLAEQAVEEWADIVSATLKTDEEARVVTAENLREVMVHCLVRRGMMPIASADDHLIRFKKV